MKQLTPLKAIRAKCLDCMCDSSNEVKLCPITDCSLYPFRFGKNPYNKRELSEEQKAELRERLKRANVAVNHAENMDGKNAGGIAEGLYR